jgi:hypothetical protein
MESDPNLEGTRRFDGVHQKGQTMTHRLPVHYVVWAGGPPSGSATLGNLGDLPVCRRAFRTSGAHYGSKGREGPDNEWA